jgi:hypothetical protein
MSLCSRVVPIIFLACAVTPAAQADIITDWNETAVPALVQAKLPAGQPTRALALMHAAMFEAVNSIQPRFAPFSASMSAPAGASAEAAASAAAYRVLSAVAPAQASVWESRHKALTAHIPDGAAKADGIALGEKVAAALVALRASDGSDFSTTYTPRVGPGMYVLTSKANMASPSLGKMKPFVLAKADQYRPPAPPAVDSAQFARDVDEVRVLGQKASAVRTKAQTDIARYHAPPGFPTWNGIARFAVRTKALDLVDSARAMALLNFATLDSQLAIWDAKYAYNLWRPRTAINSGMVGALRLASGGDTALWEPLIDEPMHPEYPCAHCGIGAAAATVMEGLFGSGTFHFPARTGALGNAVRAYSSFRQFEEEEAISRIYAGVHFRWSNHAGEFVGKQIGKKVLESLAPR